MRKKSNKNIRCKKKRISFRAAHMIRLYYFIYIVGTYSYRSIRGKSERSWKNCIKKTKTKNPFNYINTQVHSAAHECM